MQLSIQHPVMLKLTMTCCAYDRTRALIENRVQPEGVQLETAISVPGSGNHDGFDIAESYTGRYIADLPQRRLGYTAIPIFPRRMFRHSYIYTNRKAGIRSPEDLNGRRVGIQTWFTSAAIWARGLLEDEFGVDIRSIRWVAEEEERPPGWEPPPWLKLEVAPRGTKQLQLLAEGSLDAAINTGVWAPQVHPDVDFLFPQYGALERDYFKRTGFFPIMHTLLIRTAVLEKDPWVAMSVFKAWMESKRICYEEQAWQRIHMTSLFYRALWEEERALGGEDIYRWGFANNRAELNQLLEYAFRYGLIPRKFQPEELFHPSTLGT